MLDEAGAILARRRLPEGLDGVTQLHALRVEHAHEPDQVVVRIETDRGLWVASLVAAGYQVYAINPPRRWTATGTRSQAPTLSWTNQSLPGHSAYARAVERH